jgi:ubiquinone/menaquinone biosynthesis C-methylase UbiE
MTIDPLPHPPRVDYEPVAESYDQRRTDGSFSLIQAALHTLALELNARRILDLGCGTGRSLEGVAEDLESAPLCVGLDLSAAMLAQARAFNPSYRLVQATAPAPPFLPATFDVILSLHAFHHFPDKEQVVRSTYELLRPGGVLAIVNFDPREIENDWYVYDYFDGVYETDLARFPARRELEDLLCQSGFMGVQSPIAQDMDFTTTGRAVLDSYFLQKSACSQLLLLSDEAYAAGLARIRAAIAEAEARGEQLPFRVRALNRIWRGMKPIS